MQVEVLQPHVPKDIFTLYNAIAHVYNHMGVCECAAEQQRYLKHSSNSLQRISIAFEMRKC